MAVDPYKAFGEVAGREEGICDVVNLQCAAIEAGACAVGDLEMLLFWGAHGEGIDLPVGDGLAGEGDLVGDSLALASNDGGEVDPAGVLNEDVEARFRCGDVD